MENDTFIKRFLDIDQDVLKNFVYLLLFGVASHYLGLWVVILALGIMINTKIMYAFLLKSNKMLYGIAVIVSISLLLMYKGWTSTDEFFYIFSTLVLCSTIWFIVSYIAAKQSEIEKKMFLQACDENKGYIDSDSIVAEFEVSKQGRLLRYIQESNFLGKFFNVAVDQYYFNPNIKSVSEDVIKSIMQIIRDHDCKEIFYVGYADMNLIVTIQKAYPIQIADSFGRTNKGKVFFWDEKYDGPFENCPPIPDWAIDVPMQVEGSPEHDILLVDTTKQCSEYLNCLDQAKVVVLFGESELDDFTHKDLYEWSGGELLIGILKNKKNVEPMDYEEMIIDGRKILVNLNEEKKSMSVNFAI